MSLNNSFNDDAEPKRFSLFEFIVAAFEWCQIVLACGIVGLIGWFIIYYSNPNSTTKTVGVGVIIASLLVGIYLASNTNKERQENHSNDHPGNG